MCPQRECHAQLQREDAAQVTAARVRYSGRCHSAFLRTSASAWAAVHMSRKRVYSGVRPRRTMSGARKSPTTRRAISACQTWKRLRLQVLAT